MRFVASAFPHVLQDSKTWGVTWKDCPLPPIKIGGRGQMQQE